MATGVLPLVLGRATRLAQFLTASDKTYEATIAFGRATDTYDATGTVIATSDARPTRDAARIRARELSRHVTSRRRPRIPRRTSTANAPTIWRARRGRRVAQRPKAVTVTANRVEVAVVRRRNGAPARCRSRRASTCARWRTTLATRSDAARISRRYAGPAPENSGSNTPSRWWTSSRPRREVAGRPGLSRCRRCWPDVAAVTLRGPANLERLKNGVEMGPGDLVAPFVLSIRTLRRTRPESNRRRSVQNHSEVARSGRQPGGPGQAGKTPGFLRGWVVLG